MGLFTWIKGLLQPQEGTIPCGGGEITRAQWDAMRTAFPNPPTKPQPTGGRLIYTDRDPGPAYRLRKCPTHGQQPPNAWGCPECVRELRGGTGDGQGGAAAAGALGVRGF
jgi:hypothetical protein